MGFFPFRIQKIFFMNTHIVRCFFLSLFNDLFFSFSFFFFFFCFRQETNKNLGIQERMHKFAILTEPIYQNNVTFSYLRLIGKYMNDI